MQFRRVRDLRYGAITGSPHSAVTRHRAVPILVVERDIRHRYLLFRVMPHTVQLEGPVCLGVLLGLEIAKKVCYLI
jgi:hypothetical protein